MASALFAKRGSKSDIKKKDEVSGSQQVKLSKETTNYDPDILTQISGTPSSETSFHRKQSPSTSEMASTPTDESQVDGHDETNGEATRDSGGHQSKQEKRRLKKVAEKEKEKEEKKQDKDKREREKQDRERIEKGRKERERQEKEKEKQDKERLEKARKDKERQENNKDRKQEKKKEAEKQHGRSGSFFRHKKKNQDTPPAVTPHGDGQTQQFPSDDHTPLDTIPESEAVSDKKAATCDDGSPQDTQGVSGLM